MGRDNYLNTFPPRSKVIFDEIEWTFLGIGYGSNYACLGTNDSSDQSDRYVDCTYETNVADDDRRVLIPETKDFKICYWVRTDTWVTLVSLPIDIPGQKCSICKTNIEHQTDTTCVFCSTAKTIEA